MIELWGRKNAYNVQKVLWALDELNLQYSHRDVGSNKGDLQRPEFIALNPHGRIPVLMDDDAVIWESNTIIRYLAATYSENNLWPGNALRRTYADRWMDWELATLQPDFLKFFWGYYRTPPQHRDKNLINDCLTRCSAHFNKLNDHLTDKTYLAGECFTMGDIACGTCLYRYFEMGIKVAKPKYVMAWYERLSQRRAFRNTIMAPFSELKGRLAF